MNDYDTKTIFKEYRYQPIIFDAIEFKEFVDNIYFDEELLRHIPKIQKKDLVNMWFLSNPQYKDYTDVRELRNSILDNILFFSDEDYDVSQLKNMIIHSEFLIKKIPDNYESVVIYMDNDDNAIHEWNGLIKFDNRVYLRLDEYYYLNF